MAARAAERPRPFIAGEPLVGGLLVGELEESKSAGFASGRPQHFARMWRDHRLSSIAFALMLVFVCAGLLAVHFGVAHSSDDVGIQTAFASWRPHTAHTMRYLILVPFYGAIGLALLARAIANTRVRLFFGTVILASAVFNAAPIAKALVGGYQDPNAHDYAVISAARQHGLTKGYAEYCSGNINTYLSGYQVQFIPATCAPDGLYFYRWLVNDDVLSRPAERSFYLYDSQVEGAAACGPSKLAQEFGAPAEIISVDDHTAVRVQPRYYC